MSLEFLNLHHLLYFRAVAREGGVVKAAERLNVSPPTVSAQVKQLEEQVGDKLFSRTGRRLVLTDLGRTVLHYADGIFDLVTVFSHLFRIIPVHGHQFDIAQKGHQRLV